MAALAGTGRLALAAALLIAGGAGCDRDRPAAAVNGGDAMRSALAAAMATVPDDATAVAGVVVAELRATPSLAATLAALGRRIGSELGAGCRVDWLRDTDWVLVAVRPGQLEVIGAGRWPRDQAVACLPSSVVTRWRDDGTLAATVAVDDARPSAASGRLTALAASLDRRATASAVVDGSLLAGTAAADVVPPSAQLAVRAWLAGGSTRVDAAIIAADATAAAVAEAAIRNALSRTLAAPGASLLGSVAVTRAGPVIQLRAQLSPAATSAALGALASSRPPVR